MEGSGRTHTEMCRKEEPLYVKARERVERMKGSVSDAVIVACQEAEIEEYREKIQMIEKRFFQEKNETLEEKMGQIASNYGYEAQSRQLIEEMAELTQAINKYWRKDLKCGKFPYQPFHGYIPDRTTTYKNLLEEIADVQIMLWQMSFLLTGKEDINKMIEEKLDRQIRRITGEME